MAVPRRTAILLFQPFLSLAIVNGEHDTDSPAHTDTQVRIYNTVTGDLISDTTIGSAKTNCRITGLSLVAGTSYRARMRYANVDGWGSWSLNYIERVPIDLAFDAIDMGVAEPQAKSAVPIQPHFVWTLSRVRPFHEWRTESGHRIRRPKFNTERRRVQLVWENIVAEDKDIIRQFIVDAIAGSESFTVNDPFHGDVDLFPRRGTLELAHNNLAWTVRCQADEVRAT